MWEYHHTDFLCHYGVKGMKWGVRKDRKVALAKQENPDKLKDRKQSSERDLAKQSTASIQKGLRSIQSRIGDHRAKIADPKKFCAEWDSYNEIRKAGLIRHWTHEIDTFQLSVDNRLTELKRRENNE